LAKRDEGVDDNASYHFDNPRTVKLG